MPHWLETVFNFIAQIAGSAQATEFSVVWPGLAACLWAGLAFFAWSKQVGMPKKQEQLFRWALLFALVSELVLAAFCVLGELCVLNEETVFEVFPPLAVALRYSAILLVTCGFVSLANSGHGAANVVAMVGLVLIGFCYLCSFGWWPPSAAEILPATFDRTWCGLAFHTITGLLLGAAAMSLLKHSNGWIRYWALLVILSFLAVMILAMTSRGPGSSRIDWWFMVRHGVYLFSILMLGIVYVRKFVDDLGNEAIVERAWKERFEAFMDNSPFIAWVKNSDGQHQYLSKPYALQIGIPVSNWEGKTDYDLWPREVAESHREMDEVALESGKPIVFESTHPLPNGEVKHWYVVKFPFSVGHNHKETFVGGIGLDVTEKTIAEMERDRFFETSSELMCITDRDMCFKRVNQAFSDTLGFRREDFAARPFREFVHPDDLAIMDMAMSRIEPEAGDRFAQFEIRFRCSDDSYRRISWTTPAPDPQAKIDSKTIFAVGRDVTEQRALERRLLQIADEQQQRIAHDLHDGLGQELTGLAMMADSLALNLRRENLPQAGLADKIAVQLESSLELARNLARGLRPVEVDSSGLKSALLRLADQTDRRYTFRCSFVHRGNVEVVNADSATQLYRIAQEAVTNAARHAEPGSVEIQLIEDNGYLELKVIDDGIGIRNLDASRTGIGMKSMAYRSDIIGAKLRMETANEGGTILACRLPIH